MIGNYEEQLELVRGLDAATQPDDRHIAWCTNRERIGVARNPSGLIEIFISGPALDANYGRVREALEHQRWYRKGGQVLLANRLLLPAAGHFEQVAAFLCTELLRNGADSDTEKAFAATEPLVELAIDDLLIANEALTGLCGEMLLLEALLRRAPDNRVAEIATSWKGHGETARDFQLPWVGVEVKTTSGTASSHHYSGIHQLELGHGVDGAEESSFFVASIGIEWLDAGSQPNSTCLPELVSHSVQRIDAACGSSAAVVAEKLLGDISGYGPSSRMGYDHTKMADSARFRRRFRQSFARAYDMTDDTIRLLTSDDLRSRPYIHSESLRLRVDFPDQIGGDVNPTVGLTQFADLALRLSGPEPD